MHSKWQQLWDQQLLNKLHSVKPVIDSWPPLPSRRQDVILTRLRIGHTRLTHVHLLLADSAPTCQRCKVEMSTKHILVECPSYASYRIRFYNYHNISLEKLLSCPHHHNLFNFLKEIGFYSFI